MIGDVVHTIEVIYHKIANVINLNIRKASILVLLDIIWIQESPISIKQSMDIKLPGNIANNLIKSLLNEEQTEMIRKHVSYAAKKAIGQINVRKRSPNQGLLPYVLN